MAENGGETARHGRSKLAMRQKERLRAPAAPGGVTDDTVQGVPAWAYKEQWWERGCVDGQPGGGKEGVQGITFASLKRLARQLDDLCGNATQKLREQAMSSMLGLCVDQFATLLRLNNTSFAKQSSAWGLELSDASKEEISTQVRSILWGHGEVKDGRSMLNGW
eukprot:Skav226068  [mRNA]  locus=scaffold211:653102:656315:- [translate_table: standard]